MNVKNVCVGQKVGDWTVVEKALKDNKNFVRWICKCKCGSVRNFTTSYLNTGTPKCCFYCQENNRLQEDALLSKKHVGKTYGTYEIVKLSRSNGYGSRLWLCRCQCGQEREFLTSYLFGNGKRKASKCENCYLKYMEINNRITDEIPKRFWQRFLDHSKRRNINVLLSSDEAYKLYCQQNKKCIFSGIDLYFTKLKSNFNRYTNASIDRIDSSKPYALNNIQWVDKKINMMKGSLVDCEFVDLCKKIVNNFKVN